MLKLTRRIGETVMIGKDVQITVLEIKQRRVRIGIRAPITVAVHREEIFVRIRQQRAGHLARVHLQPEPSHRLL
jgi:carbon storage regulator